MAADSALQQACNSVSKTKQTSIRPKLSAVSDGEYNTNVRLQGADQKL